MVTKDFVLQTAKDSAFKSFIIYNPQGEPVYMGDDARAFGDKFAELDNWLRNNTGVYKIQLRNTHSKGLYPQRGTYSKILIGEFDVSLEKERKGIGALDVFQGVPNMDVIRTYESEIRTLDREVSRLTNELAIRDLKFEQLQRDHERELSTAKDPQKHMMGALGQMAGIFGPAMGMSRTPAEPNISGISPSPVIAPGDEKQVLIDLVNKMLKLDENFVHNLGKLVRLAETNPGMYAASVQMIDNYI